MNSPPGRLSDELTPRPPLFRKRGGESGKYFLFRTGYKPGFFVINRLGSAKVVFVVTPSLFKERGPGGEFVDKEESSPRYDTGYSKYRPRAQ
jgi:hypothetical protein